jgi:hypothetical protein
MAAAVLVEATDEQPADGKLNSSYPHQLVRQDDTVYVRGENVHTNNHPKLWSF